MKDLAWFAKLIQAIEPWREQLVLAGGWAHRLHRFHPLARALTYQPIATKDTDIVFGNDVPLEGDIRDALLKAAFKEELSGEHTPPITRYTLGDEGDGFYVEFLTPLRGGGTKRNGQPDATMAKAGITAQKLKHLDLLLAKPWSISIGSNNGFPLPKPATVSVANPAAFIVQKLLIRKNRTPAKQAQDVLYIHDTLELFGGALPALNELWNTAVAATLSTKTAGRVAEEAQETFATVTDVIRDAARIPQDRRLAPERLRTFCALALNQILTPQRGN